jgi:hypothetical protein
VVYSTPRPAHQNTTVYYENHGQTYNRPSYDHARSSGGYYSQQPVQHAPTNNGYYAQPNNGGYGDAGSGSGYHSGGDYHAPVHPPAPAPAQPSNGYHSQPQPISSGAPSYHAQPSAPQPVARSGSLTAGIQALAQAEKQRREAAAQPVATPPAESAPAIQPQEPPKPVELSAQSNGPAEMQIG